MLSISDMIFGHHIFCNYYTLPEKDCKYCKILYKRDKIKLRKEKLLLLNKN